MKLMKLIIVSLLALLTFNHSFAQTDSIMPPFNIRLAKDSSAFTYKERDSSKALLLVVFNTECELCQYETNEFREKINLFKDIQIVMASPNEFEAIQQFYKSYGLSKYPGIVVGRDDGYKLGAFYQLRAFPTMFLYDKKGKLIKRFNGSENTEDIPNAVK